MHAPRCQMMAVALAFGLLEEGENDLPGDDVVSDVGAPAADGEASTPQLESGSTDRIFNRWPSSW
jgi:hypothetical protein